MFKEVFGRFRVAGIAGNRHTGKTNNIFYIVSEFRKTNKKTPIYSYGLPKSTYALQRKLNIKPIDSLKQLANKSNCIIILDEFQQLNINDRRNKDIIKELMAFVYHKNSYVLFCSPTTREYNAIIGGYIERWLLKSMSLSDCINGSQLKQALLNYKGSYKHLDYFDIPLNELVVLNDDCEQIINCKYYKDADTKKANVNIL
jgi:hypothetical protein